MDARQVTMFLCESFPDVAEAQVAKVWEEQRGNVTRCVEVLSELSESMRRQITIIKVHNHPPPNSRTHPHAHTHTLSV